MFPLDASGAAQRLALPVAKHPRGCSSRAGLVGGTRGRHFVGTNFKPHKLLANAPTPTCQLHVSCTHEDGGRSFYTRETRVHCGKYTPNRQAHKPYKAMESILYDSRAAPWFPVKLI